MGEYLRSLRTARRWSQERVAELTSESPWPLSRSAISAIERGRNLPSLEALVALSRVFHFSPAELIERIELSCDTGDDLAGADLDERTRIADELFWDGNYRQALSVYNAILQELGHLEDLTPPEREGRRATYELRRAAALRRFGSLASARAAAERAITLARTDPQVRAEGYLVLAALHREMNLTPLALDAARRAVAVAAECGPVVRGRAWLQLGACLWQAESYAEARESFLRARRDARAGGDRRHLSHIEGNIGMCFLRLGHPDRAKAWLQRAVRLARKYAVPTLEASWLIELGGLALLDSDYALAEQCAESALHLARPREHWLTLFRVEWLRYRIAKTRNPDSDETGRIAQLRRLLVRLDRHDGDPSVQEFRATIGGGKDPWTDPR